MAQMPLRKSALHTAPNDWLTSCRCWEYTFEMTDDHMTEEVAEPMKQTYDVLGEEAYLELKQRAADLKAEVSEETAASKPETQGEPRQRNDSTETKKTSTPAPAGLNPQDLWSVLEAHHSESEVLTRLWDEIHTTPSWVDWAQIERGQKVYYRYGGPILVGLAWQSLLGGLGGSRPVETLARTGGFSVKKNRHRLFETSQFVLQVTKSLEAISPGGEGHAASVRVRLLHAAVRDRIMTMAKQRPDYYHAEEWGVPINDFDTLATTLTFSSSLVWLSLPRQGIFLREEEIADYVALWRYVGWLMGAPTDLMSTPARAKASMEVILMREIHPSRTSQILANNMIRALQDSPPEYHSADMLITMARWLNGNELCDALDLPRPSLYYWMLMAGQCGFFMLYTYIHRSIPALDERNIQSLRKLFWKLIIEAKYGLDGKETTFEFKHIPEFSTMTELGEAAKGPMKRGGLQLRNLGVFLFGVALVGGTAWASLAAAKGAFSMIF
jgi:hypothetical protein